MTTYAASYMMGSAIPDTFQPPAVSTFPQTSAASRESRDETLRGNKWHQKMGFQKPQNLDQSILQIRHNEYAPFTREMEQPSVAQLYIKQYFGDRGRQDESNGYGRDREMEDDDDENAGTAKGFGRRPSSSPHRRGPGPEWGNTHFGTKPRRRSIVEDDRNRALLDENAPPLLSIYDELIAIEQASLAKKDAHQMTPGGPNPSDFRNPLHHPSSATDLNIPIPSDRPVQKFVLHHPRAIRVSNYSESRWPDVLAALARYGQILERFSVEQPQHSPYRPVPVKVLIESDDPVVRDARLIYTDEGWTKVTYSTKEAAEVAASMSGSIFIGGRAISIEYWNQELHNVKNAAGGPPPASIFETGQGNLFGALIPHPAPARQLSFPSSQPDDLPFSTSMSLSAPNFAQSGALRNRLSTFDPFNDPTTPLPSSTAQTDSGMRLSTKMPGAKLATLKDIPGGVFVKKPSLLTRILNWITGDLFKADGRRVVDASWFGWVKDWLFGRL